MRAAVDVLRTATAPMSAEEIALVLLRAKGIEAPTKAETHLMYGAVSASLKINKDVTLHDGRPRVGPLSKPWISAIPLCARLPPSKTSARLSAD